ncbi:MAG: HlyD family efflux transporter periplasmic adaptor subunit [Verrucomicrobia bacterium]|nr:HlyD family efflux transporter periplasmic adaptor subunit [Verrucomicrobiota bacterium]
MEADFSQAVAELAALRQFSGLPRDFWPRFLAAAAKLAGAEAGAILLSNPGKTPRWTRIGDWNAGTGLSPGRTQFAAQLESIAERCIASGELAERAGGEFLVVAVRLKLLRAEDEVVLACQIKNGSAEARETLVRLNLAADVPAGFQQNVAAQRAVHEVERLAAVLDLNVPVNDATRFLPAGIAFCNGIASRFRCERASLGWVEGGYIRLRAMSRTEQFDRQMAAAQALETAMEECVDQDEEIPWPPPEGVTTVARDHEKFAAGQNSGNVCSIPLRLDGKAVAVLLCERQEPAFSASELQQLRLACDQVVRRLSELKHYDRWFGARWAVHARDYFAGWLGPEHTWSKAAAVSIAILIAALFLVRVTYRVEGNFILRSDKAAFLTAPFDGYIRQVLVRPGDVVTNGQPLLALNQAELLLQESGAIADVARYQRQADKDRAAGDIADMRIDQAQARQARAQLDLVRYRLDHVMVKSPFDGVIVEGDLRERIGAPVRQGDILFQVARINTLYAQADISESDVQNILDKSRGEIAFVARPQIKYPVTIQTIEPSAVTQKDGNVFLVRLQPVNAPASWWRPGMTGLCKLSTTKRTLFWILTHRTVDFLRMKLWF